MGWWTDFKEGVGDAWNDVTGKTAARTAARAQVSAADKASETQLKMFEQARQDQLPFLKLGLQNTNKLSELTNAGAFDESYRPQFQFQEFGQQAPQFSFSLADLNADPGVQFRMDAANKALQRSAAAKGGSLGGGQLRALSELNQGLASQEYGAAHARARGAYETALGQYNMDRDVFGRNQLARYGMFSDARNEFYQNQGNRFNRLAALSGVGQATATNLGNQGNSLAQALANNTMAAGNARAAGIVGGYNSQRDTLMGIGQLAAMYYGGA